MGVGEVGFCGQCGRSVEVKVAPEDRLQRRIMRAVDRRGYTRGWTPVQFLARQLVKMAEELGEAGELLFLFLPRSFMGALWAIKENARLVFDLKPEQGGNMIWGGDDFLAMMRDGDLDRVRDELADMQVVLCCAAEALGIVLGEDVDLMQLAVDKAEADVERGVREVNFRYSEVATPPKEGGSQRQNMKGCE